MRIYTFGDLVTVVPVPTTLLSPPCLRRGACYYCFKFHLNNYSRSRMPAWKGFVEGEIKQMLFYFSNGGKTPHLGFKGGPLTPRKSRANAINLRKTLFWTSLSESKTARGHSCPNQP